MHRGYTITPTMNAWLVVPDGDFSQIDALGLRSKADIAIPPTNVRFTLNSGHWNSVARCPLCANSGHSALR
jgi:hypothetical protein